MNGFSIFYHGVGKDAAGKDVPVLVRATQGLDPNDPWTHTTVPSSERSACVIATLDPSLSATAIAYLAKQPGESYEGKVKIDRDAKGEPGVAQDLPALQVKTITGGANGRFVPGKSEMVLAMVIGNTTQMVRYDLKTKAAIPLTRYAPGTQVNSVSVVRAPKFGPEAYVFYAIVDNHHIDSYLTTGDGTYTKVATIRPPLTADNPNIYLLDEENFVADGEPYLVFKMGDATPQASTSELWVASAYANLPNGCSQRRITDPGLAKRDDMDTYSTASDSFVYYRKVTPIGGTVLQRASAGIRGVVQTTAALANVVKGYYRDILGRMATTSETSYWISELATKDRAAVALRFLTSLEYRQRLVAGYYAKFLGRSANASEINYWVSQMNGGATAEDVLARILGSAEYKVRGGTLSPSAVTTDEYRRTLVSGWYQLYLRRAPEEAGLALWSGLLANGLRDEAVQAGVLASTEYFYLQQ